MLGSKTRKELAIFRKVNACESLEELAQVIESLADKDGHIKGRTRHFKAANMAGYCRAFSLLQPNLLTREYGIRQQAMYIAAEKLLLCL